VVLLSLFLLLFSGSFFRRVLALQRLGTGRKVGRIGTTNCVFNGGLCKLLLAVDDRLPQQLFGRCQNTGFLMGHF
jgi:hypothetical protein